MNELLDKYSQLKTAHKVAGVAVFVIITVVAHYFLLFQEVEYNQLLSQRAKLEEKKISYDAKRKSIKHTKELNDRIKERLAKKKERLPDTTELESIMREVYRKASDSGIKVATFTPKTELVKELYVEQPIFLELNGSFHETLTFLFRISKGKRIINMHDITIDKPEYRNQKTDIVSKLDIKVYRFRKKEDVLPGGKKGKKRKKGKK